jgi:hypothetical protein
MLFGVTSELGSSADWPVWRRKIRDLMDYHEGALEAIDGKITKPEPLDEKATAAQQKQYNMELDYYRKGKQLCQIHDHSISYRYSVPKDNG